MGMRILVTRTDRIGDVVLMTPLLRAQFPDAYIAALVHPRARDVLLHNPRIDELLVDEPKGEHAGRVGFWNQVREMRKRKFDTALLLLPTKRLAWMLFAAGIPRRYGVGVKLYGVLTGMKSVRREYEPLRHEADYCLDFGRKLGITSPNPAPEIFLTDDEKNAARKTLSAHGVSFSNNEFLVGIHPGSGHSAPNWKVERYVDLCKLLARGKKIRLLISGGAAEVESARLFSQLFEAGAINLIGKLSLRELAAVISLQRVFVSASTGPMHMAAALVVPTVSLFCRESNSSATHWGPLGNSATIVLPREGFCQKLCPGNPHTCEFEGGIRPSDVATAVLRVLGL
jgi:ADP-heptose:LPS heptosyltransferase